MTELQKTTATRSDKPVSITISNFRPLDKNTLRGAFDATLPSGMILRGISLHERNRARWIGLPSREYIDKSGQRQFALIIEFVNRGTANRFRDQMLEALDRFFEIDVVDQSEGEVHAGTE